MSDPAPIVSLDQLFDALGGIESAASTLDEQVSTLHVWLHRRKMPSRKYFRHQNLLAERNIAASPDLWGQEAAA